MKVFLRTAYNYDMNVASDDSGLACLDPSKAQQHAKDECDINVIVQRFGLTGRMPVGLKEPLWGDFSEVSDFRDALDRVRAAEAAFGALPAELRREFDNDPARFEGFVLDPANQERVRKAGLYRPIEEPPATVKQVVEAVKEGFAALQQPK